MGGGGLPNRKCADVDAETVRGRLGEATEGRAPSARRVRRSSPRRSASAAGLAVLVALGAWGAVPFQTLLAVATAAATVEQANKEAAEAKKAGVVEAVQARVQASTGDSALASAASELAHKTASGPCCNISRVPCAYVAALRDGGQLKCADIHPGNTWSS